MSYPLESQRQRLEKERLLDFIYFEVGLEGTQGAIKRALLLAYKREQRLLHESVNVGPAPSQTTGPGCQSDDRLCGHHHLPSNPAAGRSSHTHSQTAAPAASAPCLCCCWRRRCKVLEHERRGQHLCCALAPQAPGAHVVINVKVGRELLLQEQDQGAAVPAGRLLFCLLAAALRVLEPLLPCHPPAHAPLRLVTRRTYAQSGGRVWRKEGEEDEEEEEETGEVRARQSKHARDKGTKKMHTHTMAAREDGEQCARLCYFKQQRACRVSYVQILSSGQIGSRR